MRRLPTLILVKSCVAMLILVVAFIALSEKTESNKGQVNGPRRVLSQYPNESDYPTQTSLSPNKTNRVAVLIVSNSRSGSSFLAELFNQHPDFYYVYEPLLPLEKLISGSQRSINGHEELIGNLIDCRFNRMSSSWWNLREKERQCRFNKALSKSSVCSRLNHQYHQPELVSNICRKHKNIAIKFIRLHDLESVKYLFEKKGVNVKVIHLVRDPRAVVSSRTALWTSDMDNIAGLCDQMRTTTVQGIYAPFLKDRYKMVRFEDLALYPIQTVKSLYQFIGIDIRREVIQWILENTEHNEGDVYSTIRNSTDRAINWRARMSNIDWDEIQDLCGDIMKTLGYTSVPFNHAKNTSIPLFTRLPKYLLEQTQEEEFSF